MQQISKNILAKWMPRKKQYNNFASMFRKHFKMSPKEYRQLIVGLSNTIEQQMCNKEWKDIKYDHIPSVAFKKYRKAFYNNDSARFIKFLEAVEKGEKKIHAGAIFPHDIISPLITVNYEVPNVSEEEKKAIDAQWKNLPNYLEKSKERILPVCDVSGSMSSANAGLPMKISVALGLYLSERNTSIFKDAFISFSGNPKMEYLKGTVSQRAYQLEHAHWDGNTDIEAVFQLILRSAKKDEVSENEMPTTILIISDMEFDSCGSITNYDNIVKMYKIAGYNIPKLVFWNVNGREGNVPVSKKTKNVALISGASPAIIESVLTGETVTPEKIMLRVLNSERYSEIKL